MTISFDSAEERDQENPVSGWAVLELFGHQTIAGEIQKVEPFGKPMVRVSVPAIDEAHPAFTRDYSPDAIYGITYTTEQVALWTAKAIAAKPINVYVPDIDDVAPLKAENRKLKQTIAQLTGALPAPYSERE